MLRWVSFVALLATASAQVPDSYQLQGDRTLALLEFIIDTGTGTLPFPRRSTFTPAGQAQPHVWTDAEFAWWLQGWLAINVYAVGCTESVYEQFRMMNTTTASPGCNVGGDVSVSPALFNPRGSAPTFNLVVPFFVTAQQLKTGVDQRDLCMKPNDIDRLKFSGKQFGFSDVRFTCDVSLLDTKKGSFVGCSCSSPEETPELGEYILNPFVTLPLFGGMAVGAIIVGVVWGILHNRRVSAPGYDQGKYMRGGIKFRTSKFSL